jgi:hypothetical protein
MALVLGDEYTTLPLSYTTPALVELFPCNHPIWNHKLLSIDPTGMYTQRRGGLGIPIPGADQPFTPAEWAQYFLYHGHPRTTN